MSRRQAKKSDMDDLDDVLGDLLGSDDDVPKKKPVPVGGRGRPGAKPSVLDDDFYSSLAAEAEDSDISEANPDDIAKSLAGLDDMDADLFGPKKTPSRGSTPKTPTTPASKGGSRPNSKGSKLDDLGFDDDDPLAGLLSDDEDTKPKLKSVAGRKGTPKIEEKSTEPEEDTNSQSSRRLEIDRPPTRSGNNSQATSEAEASPAGGRRAGAGRRRADDISFDDEDVLGGMGLESPRVKHPFIALLFDKEPVKKKVDKDVEEREASKNFLSGLMGKDTSVSKHLERPGTGDSKREFVLDKKYNDGEAGGSGGGGRAKKEPDEEDFNFGSYMPSVASGSRPNSRRSVRFEDDEDGPPGSRGGSAGGRRRPGSMLEDMVNKDDRDWLDIASGDSPTHSKPKAREDDGRPRSEGSLRDKPGRPDTSNSAASEPVDWLGLSRLGSPDTAGLKAKNSNNNDDDYLGLGGDEPDASKPLKSALKTPPSKDDPADDWLGLGSSAKNTSQSQRRASKGKDIADDWLGLSDNKDTESSSDWLGIKKDKTPPKVGGQAGRSDKADDWLGTKDTKSQKQDDWLGTGGKSDKSNSGDDWLGLGENKSSEPGGDYLGLGADADPDGILGKSAPQKTADDLFNTPAKRDMSSSLPWDSMDRPRSGRRAAKTPPNTGGSTRGPPSPADSPRGLMNTIAALKEMDEREKKVEPATPMSTMGQASSIGLDTQSSFMGQMMQQEAMVKQQQEMMIKQQQQQQQIMQQQMAAQQEQMRKQQEAQMRAMQEAQRMMSSNMAMPMQMPSMPSMPSLPSMPSFGMGGAFGLSGFGEDLQGKIRTLELEKQHLEAMLETAKSQHKEEIKLIEESFKKRSELSEEMYTSRQNRLKEENEILSSQNIAKLKMVEQEKSDLVSIHIQRQEEWEKNKSHELERIREQHRQDMLGVRQEHEESLNRLRRTKDLEVEAIASTQNHSRSLQELMGKISANADELGSLQSKVEGSHLTSLDERENAAKERDHALKVLQERLERQHHDNEMERSKLQGLIVKLETQLTDQARTMEEDRWQLSQEKNRVHSLQGVLEREKEAMREQVKRERSDLQRAREQLLDEQKTVLLQLQEERRSLADDRAQFNMAQKLKTDQDQRASLKSFKSEAEVESNIKMISEEKMRLAQQAAELRHEKERLSAEVAVMEQDKQSLRLEKEKLEHLALQVKQRSHDIEEMVNTAARTRDDGDQALSDAKRLEAEQSQRLQNIQAQLATLRSKEKQIAQERLALAKEKQSLETVQGSMLCVSCRTPIRDTTPKTAPQPQAQSTPMPAFKMSAAAVDLYTSLDTGTQGQVSSLDSIKKAIETDRAVRAWRMQAQKDQSFLEEESMFLEAIKHSPYHATPS